MQVDLLLKIFYLLILGRVEHVQYFANILPT